MTLPLEDTRRWVETGTRLVAGLVDGADDAALEQPSHLPGWTGKHVLGHLAANADALRNLARWARTGVESPMYSSTDQRGADIERASTLSAAELIAWFHRSAQELDADFDATTAEQWQAQVRTAQGRTVPFQEVPWMRTREVLVHATDLPGGPGFEALPDDALVALADDIVAKRSKTPDHPALTVTAGGHEWTIGQDPAVTVRGALPDAVAYLAGRRHGDLTTDGGPLPELPAWL